MNVNVNVNGTPSHERDPVPEGHVSERDPVPEGHVRKKEDVGPWNIYASVAIEFIIHGLAH